MPRAWVPLEHVRVPLHYLRLLASFVSALTGMVLFDPAGTLSWFLLASLALFVCSLPVRWQYKWYSACHVCSRVFWKICISRVVAASYVSL